jgi:hypothetical protein
VSTPEERLVEDLKASGNQPRGWRRAALRVKLKLPPLKNKLKSHMKAVEKNQLMAEVRLLESYFRLNGKKAPLRSKGKFKSRKKKDLVSLQSLVCDAWGKSNAFLTVLRREQVARNVATALNDDFCNELLVDSDLGQKKKRTSIASSRRTGKRRSGSTRGTCLLLTSAGLLR